MAVAKEMDYKQFMALSEEQLDEMTDNFLVSKRKEIEKKVNEIIELKTKSSNEKAAECSQIVNNVPTVIKTVSADVFYELNIKKEDLFLFDQGLDKNMVYKTQLLVLEHADKCIESINALIQLKNMVDGGIKQFKEPLTEFCIYISPRDLSKSEQITDIINELTNETLPDLAETLEMREEEILPTARDTITKQINIAKKLTDELYVPFDSATRGQLLKAKKVFDKYKISNHITHTVTDNVIKDQKVLNALHDSSIPEIKKRKEQALKKTTEKKLMVKTIVRILTVVLYIVSFGVLILFDDALAKGWPDVAPTVFALSTFVVCPAVFIITGIFGGKIKRKERQELKKLSEEMKRKVEEYDKKYYDMFFDVADDYYERTKEGYFDKQELLVKTMREVKRQIQSAIENLQKGFRENSKKYLPDGLIDNPRVLKTVIEVMKEGRASEYKAARSIAADIIEAEDRRDRETRYLADKAAKDEIHRRKVLASQARAESAAKEQAAAARRAAEAQERAAVAMLNSQRSAEGYAKEQAESMQKLLEIEKNREIREEEMYWRNKTNT